MSIEAAETVDGAHPDKTIGIAGDASHMVIRQTRFHIEPGEMIFALCKRNRTHHPQQRKEPTLFHASKIEKK